VEIDSTHLGADRVASLILDLVAQKGLAET